MKFCGWSRACVAALACTLAACGGGKTEDGRSVDLGPPTGRLSIDRTSVSLVGVNGQSGYEDAAILTLQNPGKGYRYFVAAWADSDRFEAAFVPAGESGTLQVLEKTPMDLGSRATGKLTVLLCTDPDCVNEIQRLSVPYTATMFQIDQTPLALQGNEEAVSAPVRVAILPPDNEALLRFVPADATLVVDHADPGSFGVSVSGKGVREGNYSTNVDFQFGDRSLMMGIPVSVTVDSGIVAPAVAPIEVTSATTKADLLGLSAPVAFAGGQHLAWTAESDQPWLVLDTRAGTGAGSFDYHVDASRLDAVPNWNPGIAKVTLHAAGLSDATASITLNKKLPEVDMVSPSGILPGRAATVRISGRGLSQLAGISSLSVGGRAPTSGSIDSDTSATIAVPALPAGAVAISVPNRVETPTAVAKVGVFDPRTLGASSSPANLGVKRTAVFDSTRVAVFATDYDENTLVRYRWTGSAWQLSGLTVPEVGRLALSPDRGTVYVESGSKLLEIDPDTMENRASHEANRMLNQGLLFSQPLALTSDMRLWFGLPDDGGTTYFDLRTGTFRAQDFGADDRFTARDFFASPDGLHLIGLKNSSVESTLWVDVRSNSATQPQLGDWVSEAVFDEHGTVMMGDNWFLYGTSDFELKGRVDVDHSGAAQGWRATLSPDGSRIYLQVSVGNDTIDHIDVLDASALEPGTSRFAKLGEIPVSDSAVSCPGGVGGYCDNGRLLIDPTGSTLFWVGNAKMVVIQIPETLSGIASAPRAHAARADRRLDAARLPRSR